MTHTQTLTQPNHTMQGITIQQRVLQKQTNHQLPLDALHTLLDTEEQEFRKRQLLKQPYHGPSRHASMLLTCLRTKQHIGTLNKRRVLTNHTHMTLLEDVRFEYGHLQHDTYRYMALHLLWYAYTRHADANNVPYLQDHYMMRFIEAAAHQTHIDPIYTHTIRIVAHALFHHQFHHAYHALDTYLPHVHPTEPLYVFLHFLYVESRDAMIATSGTNENKSVTSTGNAHMDVAMCRKRCE